MSVLSLPGYVPPPRYDDLPWVAARLEESATQGGLYTETETFTLDPEDTDPASPQSRDFSSALGTQDYWYRLVWVDATAAESQPTTPGQNTSGTVPPAAEPYATAAELAKILTVNAASNAEALDRVLIAAAGSINSELGRIDLSGWELELAAEVNLALAQDLWEEMKVHAGLVGLDSMVGPTRVSRDIFARHAYTLAPLKRSWGIA